MKEGKDKGTRFLAGIKRAVILLLASTASGAFFFALAHTVDVFVRRTAYAPPKPALPFENRPAPPVKSPSPAAARNPDASSKLTFYDTLIKNVPDNTLLPKNTKPAEPKNGREKPVQENKPSAQEKEQQLQQQKPPAEATYVLQFGAFQKPEKAATLVNELKSKGYNPYTDTISVQGKGSLTRVRMGGFRSLTEARGKAAEIQSKTNFPVNITRR
ncbi:MAG: SPOR domain-containing protein [Proteobacteria bacterium]|nr:SPOR domain-containing protein [Pseudomonadota bacterium]